MAEQGHLIGERHLVERQVIGMDVHVPEAGHQIPAFEIDHLRVAGATRLSAWQDGRDAAILLAAVDLPLSFIAYSPKGEGRSPQRKYATLEPRTCIRLLRPMLAPWPQGIMARHAIAVWWVYGPRAAAGREARFRVALGEIIRGCGFTYTTELLAWIKIGEAREIDGELWFKPEAFGTGFGTRKGVENVWGSKRGKGVPIRSHKVDQRIFASRLEHSEKPDEAYRRLEQLYGDVHGLELFGTKLRLGWTVWGHIKGSEFVARLRAASLL